MVVDLVRNRIRRVFTAVHSTSVRAKRVLGDGSVAAGVAAEGFLSGVNPSMF